MNTTTDYHIIEVDCPKTKLRDSHSGTAYVTGGTCPDCKGSGKRRMAVWLPEVQPIKRGSMFGDSDKMVLLPNQAGGEYEPYWKGITIFLNEEGAFKGTLPTGKTLGKPRLEQAVKISSTFRTNASDFVNENQIGPNTWLCTAPVENT